MYLYVPATLFIIYVQCIYLMEREKEKDEEQEVPNPPDEAGITVIRSDNVSTLF